MKFLTVENLIKLLGKEDPKSLIAVKDSESIVFLIEDSECLKPNVYIRKEAKKQNKYYFKEELGEEEIKTFVKIILINA